MGSYMGLFKKKKGATNYILISKQIQVQVHYIWISSLGLTGDRKLKFSWLFDLTGRFRFRSNYSTRRDGAWIRIWMNWLLGGFFSSFLYKHLEGCFCWCRSVSWKVFRRSSLLARRRCCAVFCLAIKSPRRKCLGLRDVPSMNPVW